MNFRKLSQYLTMGLEIYQWDELLEQISLQQCTPFIGPEAYAPWLPLSMETVTRWTGSYGYPLVFEEFNNFYKIAREKYGYPLEDSHQLAKVAQFLAIERGNDIAPKQILSKELKDIKPPDFSLQEHEDNPYRVLADLNLPIYITTNYDYFMESALENRGKKPVSEFCRWNEKLYRYTETAEIPSVFDKDQKYERTKDLELKYRPTRESYRPSPAEPLVYHLHGIYEIPQSLVLTEKDYLDFAINLNKNDEKISLPHSVRKALAGSLLFVGYRLEDITFRVIFQGVIRILGEIQRPISIAVQLAPQLQQKAQSYLNRYTQNMFEVIVYWDSLDKFSIELRRRWDDFKKKRGSV